MLENKNEITIQGNSNFNQSNKFFGQANEVLEQASEMLGYSNETLGYPNEMLGYPSEMLGYPNEMLGYLNETLGYPNEMLGYSNETLGYPNETLGYPNEMLGYPNETINYTHILHLNSKFMVNKSDFVPKVELEFAAWAENFNYRIPDYQQTLDIPTVAITMLGNQLKTYHDAELKIERGDTSKAAILLRNDAHKKLEANNE